MLGLGCRQGSSLRRCCGGSVAAAASLQNTRCFGVGARARPTKYKFVDKAKISVKAGAGGNGCIAFDMLGPGKKRPSGGNGGRGGSIYICADRSTTSLNLARANFAASAGEHGRGAHQSGKTGEDVIIKVPCGTVVSDITYEELADDDEEETEDSENYEEYNVEDCGNELQGELCTESEDFLPSPQVDLQEHGEMLLVAKGGDGGQGNLATAVETTQSSARQHRTPGTRGQRKTLLLELKLLSQVGLVGLPNAGKSTLLRALSRAKPQVASYPFTTLQPMIGVVEYSDYHRITVADLPGIISGAHMNRGLGHAFLRHIERTKLLVYVIDVSTSGYMQPVKDLDVLMNELRLYDPDLVLKPSVVFLNKCDIATTQRRESIETAVMKHGDHLAVLWGSGQTCMGISQLAGALRTLMGKYNADNDDDVDLKHHIHADQSNARNAM